jgi:hypothetical protein
MATREDVVPHHEKTTHAQPVRRLVSEEIAMSLKGIHVCSSDAFCLIKICVDRSKHGVSHAFRCMVPILRRIAWVDVMQDSAHYALVTQMEEGMKDVGSSGCAPVVFRLQKAVVC